MTRRIPVWLAAVLACGGAVLPSGIAMAVQPLPCRYAVSQIIQAPPVGGNASGTAGFSINMHGVVTGSYNPGGFGNDRAFYWSEATGFVSIHPAGFSESRAGGINDQGVIACSGLGPQGYRGWTHNIHTGERRFVAAPDGGFCGLGDINNAGVACGSRSINDGGQVGYPQNAFIFKPDGTIVDIVSPKIPYGRAQRIAEDGTVIGYIDWGTSTQPFTWKDSVLAIMDIPACALGSRPIAIVNQNQIALTSVVTQEPFESLVHVWDGRKYMALPRYRDYLAPYANGYDLFGRVLLTGEGSPTNGNPAPLVFHRGVMVNLNEVWMDDIYLFITDPMCFAADGRLLCSATDVNADRVSVLLQPIPGQPGDVDCDYRVDVTDILRVVGSWGPCDPCNEDLSEDRVVDVRDLIEVIINWTF